MHVCIRYFLFNVLSPRGPAEAALRRRLYDIVKILERFGIVSRHEAVREKAIVCLLKFFFFPSPPDDLVVLPIPKKKREGTCFGGLVDRLFACSLTFCFRLPLPTPIRTFSLSHSHLYARSHRKPVRTEALFTSGLFNRARDHAAGTVATGKRKEKKRN